MRTALAGLAGLALGCALMWSFAPAPVDPVATFNDGWADAKQDDCQQGFEAACMWVMIQRHPSPPGGVSAMHECENDGCRTLIQSYEDF